MVEQKSFAVPAKNNVVADLGWMGGSKHIGWFQQKKHDCSKSCCGGHGQECGNGQERNQLLSSMVTSAGCRMVTLLDERPLSRAARGGWIVAAPRNSARWVYSGRSLEQHGQVVVRLAGARMRRPKRGAEAM